MLHGFNFPAKGRRLWIFGVYNNKNQQNNRDAPSEDFLGITM